MQVSFFCVCGDFSVFITQCVSILIYLSQKLSKTKGLKMVFFDYLCIYICVCVCKPLSLVGYYLKSFDV